MKRFLVITILGLTALLTLRVNAQSTSTSAATDPFQSDQAPVIQDVPGLRADFKQFTQDPDTKQVEFDMVLKAGIDSDRVEINWTVVGTSTFADSSKATQTLAVQNGQTYNIPIDIIPTGYGVTELRGTAEAFKADSTYLISVRKNFASNASSEILPITSDYTQAKNLSLIKNILIIVVVLILTGVVILFGYKRFFKWLNRDDRK